MKKLAVEYYLQKRKEKKRNPEIWRKEIERLDKVYHYLDSRELKMNYKRFLEEVRGMSVSDRRVYKKKIDNHFYICWGLLISLVLVCGIAGISGIRRGALPSTMLMMIVSVIGILLLAYRMTSPEYRVWMCARYEGVLTSDQELMYVYGRLLYEFYGTPKVRPKPEEYDDFFGDFNQRKTI